MPEKKTIKKAQEAKWKQGANNTKQAIAIGLSEARRSGVVIPDKVKKNINC